MILLKCMLSILIIWGRELLELSQIILINILNFSRTGRWTGVRGGSRERVDDEKGRWWMEWVIINMYMKC